MVVRCKAVRKVALYPTAAWWLNGDAAGHCVLISQIHRLAHREGFANWTDMRNWFVANHGLPYDGEMIEW